MADQKQDKTHLNQLDLLTKIQYDRALVKQLGELALATSLNLHPAPPAPNHKITTGPLAFASNSSHAEKPPQTVDAMRGHGSESASNIHMRSTSPSRSFSLSSRYAYSIPHRNETVNGSVSNGSVSSSGSALSHQNNQENDHLRMSSPVGRSRMVSNSEPSSVHGGMSSRHLRESSLHSLPSMVGSSFYSQHQHPYSVLSSNCTSPVSSLSNGNYVRNGSLNRNSAINESPRANSSHTARMSHLVSKQGIPSNGYAISSTPPSSSIFKAHRPDAISANYSSARPVSLYASPDGTSHGSVSKISANIIPNLPAHVQNCPTGIITSMAPNPLVSLPSFVDGVQSIKRNQQYVPQSPDRYSSHKMEALEKDNARLNKKYAELNEAHLCALSRLDLAHSDLVLMRSDFDKIRVQFSAALEEKKKHEERNHTLVAQCDALIKERDDLKQLIASVQVQRDEAMKELNQMSNYRIYATREISRLTEERNAAVNEYSLIMSERDSVHKEIEKLQDELQRSHMRNKELEMEKQTFTRSHVYYYLTI